MRNKNSNSEIDFESLIKLARKAIKTKTITENNIKEKRGVFVTLHTFPEKKLRGCIGFIEPIYPLGEGVQRAAIAAAYSDPRFKPLSKEEIDKVTIEVSVLSLPEETTLEEIKKGDGVILKYQNYSALFLPQVWDELPDKEGFLDALCMKAGLFPRCWKESEVSFYKFYVTAFEEEEPNGEIREVKI
ncbi:MAG: AmmeMemoRadiSam system protein A [Nanoarchaeota archaeon]|nr:AmmeMemoRadiSam system protein A [Nanoarchaeota archaeon]